MQSETHVDAPIAQIVRPGSRYKRNQVEQAIAEVLGLGSARVSSGMRTKMKRLLDVDRTLGRNKKSANPEFANFAFYSSDRPGKGTENWFSFYETFALLTALRLMGHAWPQATVVAVLRRARPTLEKDLIEILAKGWSVQSGARPGDLVVETANPVFLVIQSDDRGMIAGGPDQFAVCKGQQAVMRFILSREIGLMWTIFELSKAAYGLASTLTKTRPQKRGRGAG